MSDTQEVRFDSVMRKEDRVTVFKDDAPGAKPKMIVRAIDNDTGTAYTATIEKVLPFSVTMLIINKLPDREPEALPEPDQSDLVSLDDGEDKREVHYAHTVGGYVLIDPETDERLCTPHLGMNDIAKIASQHDWYISARHKSDVKAGV